MFHYIYVVHRIALLLHTKVKPNSAYITQERKVVFFFFLGFSVMFEIFTQTNPNFRLIQSEVWYKLHLFIVLQINVMPTLDRDCRQVMWAWLPVPVSSSLSGEQGQSIGSVPILRNMSAWYL